MAVLSRMVVAENRAPVTVEIREYFRCAPSGRYSGAIRLNPHGRKEFPATKFHQCNLYSGRPSKLKVFVNGVEAQQRLTPQTFLRYVKLVFDVDDDGHLIVKGVRPKLSDICRLWGFGFLGGREYKGRAEERIA